MLGHFRCHEVGKISYEKIQCLTLFYFTFPLRTEPVVLFVLSMMILRMRCDLELSEFISMKI